MTERMTTAQMLSLSASAIRKIKKHGRRGTSMVTFDEIEALAFLAISFSADALTDTPTKEDTP